MADFDVSGLPGWKGGDGNAAYLDKILRHQPVEIALDDRVEWRAIAQLAVSAFLASLLVCLPVLFLVFLVAVGGDTDSVTTLFSLMTFLSGVTFWAVLLGSRLTEPIGEWRVLLADREDRVDSVYSKIAGTLAHRRIPITAASRPVYTGVGARQVSNRLILTEGHCRAYVSVFGYGSSLYLGWQMWRSRRGYVLIGKYVADTVGGMLGRNGPEVSMMRTERVRAMREAVHAACREGLGSAIEGVDVPVSFGFPHGLPPLVEADSSVAPLPGPQSFAGHAPAAPPPASHPSHNAPPFDGQPRIRPGATPPPEVPPGRHK